LSRRSSDRSEHKCCGQSDLPYFHVVFPSVARCSATGAHPLRSSVGPMSRETSAQGAS
jgi:hypothetical protein